MILLNIVMVDFLIMHESLDGMFCMLYKVHGQTKFWVDATLSNKCNENLVLFLCRQYLVVRNTIHF
jgi:hypothetical protein